MQDLHLLPSLLPDLFPLQVSLCPFYQDTSLIGLGSLMTQGVKNPPANAGTQVQSLGQEECWEEEMQPIEVFLPGNFHGQRSLAGCSS